MQEELSAIKKKTDRIGFEFLENSTDVLEYAQQLYSGNYVPFIRVISVSENTSVPAQYSTGLIIGRRDTLSVIFFFYLNSAIYINSCSLTGGWTGWKRMDGHQI